MSTPPKSICVVTDKEGKTKLLHAGDYPECLEAMRKAGESFKKPGESVAAIFSRDGKSQKSDDGSFAAYTRQLEKDKKAAAKAAASPKPKRSAKKKAEQQT